MSDRHTTATQQDHELARTAAIRAGEVLLELRKGLEDWSATALRDEADRLANEVIFHVLQTGARDGDGILSEEAPDDTARLQCDRVWVIDPLDGTREFAEAGRDDWAVHVGLSISGIASAGAVAVPGAELLFHTGDPPQLVETRGGQPRVAVSRTRSPAIASWICDQLGGEMVAMGSAGAKAMAVLRGEVDAYVHAGGQYEWDSCAPVAVVTAAGLHASRLSGADLRYNQELPYLPDLVICRPELADDILTAVSEYPG